MTSYAAQSRVYDHRVREFICLSGDPNLFPELDIPRSTAAGWIRDGPRDVVTAELFTMSYHDLRLEVQKLRERVETITAVLRLVLTLLRVFDVRLDGERLPAGKDKAKVLHAIDGALKALTLKSALLVLKLSAASYHAWKRGHPGKLVAHWYGRMCR